MRETSIATRCSVSETPLFPRSPFDLIVIAASAGGIPTIKSLLAALPPDFSAAIAIVQHLSPCYPSMLPDVVGARARLPVKFAREGDRLRAGSVFMAPPNQHLVLSAQRRFSLTDSEKVNYVRPAADLLFQTASRAFGPRTLGVILSGMGQDGAEGALAIKRGGGVVLVQDPATTDAPSMPEAVIKAGSVDLVFGPEALAKAITALVISRNTLALLGLPKLGSYTSPAAA